MNQLYMIEFKLRDKFHFASVFESRHSPSTYHVSLVGRDLLPNKLIFKEVGGEIQLSSESNRAAKSLIEAIISTLENHKKGKD